MATNYPQQPDTFIEPTLPEDTPLSSAGSGDRNHVEHHRDLGDAVEALERNAALKGHDHSGDSSAIGKGAKLSQANTHQNVDTDTSAAAIHHTVGEDENQAAPGHPRLHDYDGPFIINKPFERCTSMQRPPPLDGKIIWERDTRRMRVWGSFPGNRQAVQGLYYVDKLERVSTTDLGPGWNLSYTLPNGAGKYATPNGHSASWIKAGAVANRAIARRTDSATKYTQTFDQVITFTTNDHVADWNVANADNPNTNDAYFRMSDDGQTYVRAALTWWKGSTGAIMLTYTTSGPLGEQLIGQLPAQTNTANIMWQLRLVGQKFEVYMGVEYIGAIQDNTGVTATGFKGWGFGAQAGDGGFEQSLPNEISEVGIADATYYTSSALWQLLPVGDLPKVGLGAGRPQQINPTGTLIEWDVVKTDTFGFWQPSDHTTLIIREAGTYHVHASVVWGTQLLGDRAVTVIMVNGLQTPHQHWEFVRGNNYVPGFSQTVDVTAYLELAEGDRLSIAAAHNGGGPQYTGYKKNEQITQMSRLFIAFHSA